MRYGFFVSTLTRKRVTKTHAFRYPEFNLIYSGVPLCGADITRFLRTKKEAFITDNNMCGNCATILSKY